MRTKVLVIMNDSRSMSRALLLAEKVAAHQKLSENSAMQLRLLTEEMINMIQAITGEEEKRFWIEEEENVYQLHLRVETRLDYETRENLLSASSSGKNEAARGFIGKVRSFFDRMDDADVPMNLSSDGWNGTWSMRVYEETLQNQMRQLKKGTSEAWDQLEKSVVFHIADDVKVSIRGMDVEMVIIKKMK